MVQRTLKKKRGGERRHHFTKERESYQLTRLGGGREVNIRTRMVGEWWAEKVLPWEHHRERQNILVRPIDTKLKTVRMQSRTGTFWTHAPHSTQKRGRGEGC